MNKTLKFFSNIGIYKTVKKGLLIVFVLSLISVFFEIIVIKILMPYINSLFNSENSFNVNFLNINFFFETKDISTITIFILFIIIANIVFSLSNYFNNILAFKIGQNITSSFIKKLFDINQNQFNQLSVGKYLNNFILEIDRFSENILLPFFSIFLRLNIIIILFCLSLTIAFKEILIILVSLILSFFLINYLFGNLAIKIGKKISDIQEKRINTFSQIFNNLPEIKIFNLSDLFINRISNISNNIIKYKSTSNFIILAPRYLIEAVVISIFIIIISQLGQTNLIIITGISYIGLKIFPHIQAVFFSFLKIKANYALFNNIIEFNSLIETHDLKKSNTFFNLEKEKTTNISCIKIFNIFIQISENKFLNLKDIEIKFDKLIVGLVGPNGSGKSTFLKFLTGQLNFKGELKFLYNTSYLKSNKWQDSISYISQYTKLFPRSALWNITFNDNVDPNKKKLLIEIINLCSLDKLFLFDDKTFNKHFFQDDLVFSGGETSRICLARAIYHNKKVLILDELSSSYDQITENNVLNNLKEYAQKKNIMIIMSAHRKKAIDICDQLIIFKKNFIKSY